MSNIDKIYSHLIMLYTVLLFETVLSYFNIY